MAGNFNEFRARGNVIVPEIVVDNLESPHEFSARGSERNNAVRVLVVTGAQAAIEIRRCAAGWNQDQIVLCVNGHGRPGIGRTGFSGGVGSQLHCNLPVSVLKARTVPRSISARLLSPIEEPAITTLPATTGADSDNCRRSIPGQVLLARGGARSRRSERSRARRECRKKPCHWQRLRRAPTLPRASIACHVRVVLPSLGARRGIEREHLIEGRNYVQETIRGETPASPQMPRYARCAHQAPWRVFRKSRRPRVEARSEGSYRRQAKRRPTGSTSLNHKALNGGCACSNGAQPASVRVIRCAASVESSIR